MNRHQDNRENTFNVIRSTLSLKLGSNVKSHIALLIATSGSRGLFADVQKIAELTELNTRTVLRNLNPLVESGVVKAFLRQTKESVSNIGCGRQYIFMIKFIDALDGPIENTAKTPKTPNNKTPNNSLPNKIIRF